MFNSEKPDLKDLPTTGQLLRSTVLAFVTAAVLLVAVVLPAEYGIDPTGIGRMLQLTKMGDIKQQLAAESEDNAKKKANASKGSAKPNTTTTAAAKTAQETLPSKSDEMTLVLKPGQGAEVKMQMTKGAKASYTWSATGGVLYFDKHGDSFDGKEHSYEIGRDADKRDGAIVAEFNGLHGWYWKNRGKSDVTISLTTKGAYSAIAKM